MNAMECNAIIIIDTYIQTLAIGWVGGQFFVCVDYMPVCLSAAVHIVSLCAKSLCSFTSSLYAGSGGGNGDPLNFTEPKVTTPPYFS